MKLSEIKTDSVLVILVLAVVVGGFWMNGKAVNEKTDALMTQIEGLEMSVKQLEQTVRRSRPPLPTAPAAAEPVAPAPAPQ